MERPIWGPDEGVMPPRKYLFRLPVLPVRTSGPRLELPVGTGTSGGWRRKVQFCTKMNYRYFQSEIRTSGGDQNFRWSLTGSTGRCLF
jgi:hypothetical protein